ncbi:hypothetical protein LEP1GSC036_4505 [Leptospira weilii str. 2006001853]|uniref:Uncharacterized protein n=3 Tax=Leptospira weilii TaxID=28184 RepID=A0A828Z9F7_9LEPT|nr:hypothetical protein LEP1GSC036_4505 [Leptospira weilii str. 2006001853]EMJ60034.1 hypothetical protein LEP1GSC051_0521 [Leptospira sp. P2653]EMM71751.1 hypothetical protein LEP1GSC038_4055 [Leptospira weilii str. 2006001855]EMN46267.1 hypothetical protein LEP1GSC086_3018 [Leptospira weilii str. LNT 1234]EMN92347.1 hypothetical protein LEP1GSC108_1194 [Leptospira weilii str. UI 13098]
MILFQIRIFLSLSRLGGFKFENDFLKINRRFWNRHFFLAGFLKTFVAELNSFLT